MKQNERTVLADVARAYMHSRERYQQHSQRGDVERADAALAEMQDIERCVTVIETSTAWRHTRDGDRR